MLTIDDFTLLTDGSFQYDQDPGEPGYPYVCKRRSINSIESAILTVLADNELVLEIGTGLGVSTKALGKKAIEIHTVDVDPWVHENIRPGILTDAYCHFLDKIPTEDMLKEYYTLAFIDGNHEKYAVQHDIEACLELRIPKIILHDVDTEQVQEGARLAGATIHQIGHTRLGLCVF